MENLSTLVNPPAVAVLLLTCLTCRATREQPLNEPFRFECPDADCGGWVLTAQLVEVTR